MLYIHSTGLRQHALTSQAQAWPTRYDTISQAFGANANADTKQVHGKQCTKLQYDYVSINAGDVV